MSDPARPTPFDDGVDALTVAGAEVDLLRRRTARDPTRPADLEPRLRRARASIDRTVDALATLAEAAEAGRPTAEA